MTGTRPGLPTSVEGLAGKGEGKPGAGWEEEFMPDLLSALRQLETSLSLETMLMNGNLSTRGILFYSTAVLFPELLS